MGLNRNIADLSKMEKYIDVDIDDLKRLKQAQFYLKVGSDTAQHIEVPSSLKDNTADMKPQKWEQVRAEQIAKYYTSRNTPPNTTAEPSEPQREQPADGQKDVLREFGKPTNIKPSEMDI